MCIRDSLYTARDNIKKTNQACGPMTDVLKFHKGRSPGHHRFVRIFMFQYLYPSHFIRGYRTAARFSGICCLLINGTDLIDFLCEGFRIVRLLGGMKPIANEIWADFPHILKNG